MFAVKLDCDRVYETASNMRRVSIFKCIYIYLLLLSVIFTIIITIIIITINNDYNSIIFYQVIIIILFTDYSEYLFNFSCILCPDSTKTVQLNLQKNCVNGTNKATSKLCYPLTKYMLSLLSKKDWTERLSDWSKTSTFKM